MGWEEVGCGGGRGSRIEWWERVCEGGLRDSDGCSMGVVIWEGMWKGEGGGKGVGVERGGGLVGRGVFC